MRGATNILILLFITTGLHAQYVQPMSYKDYSFPWHVNIGSGVTKTTDANAYLEVGKSSGSTKGILIPRGSKEAVVSPSAGLIMYDIPSGKIVWHDGTTWRSAGDNATASVTALYKSNDTVYYTIGGVTNWFTTGAGSSTTVNKFNNRTGNVMPQTGDYTWAMVTGKPTTVAYFSDAYTQAQINNFLTGKISYSDTASLFAQFLRPADTLSLDARIKAIKTDINQSAGLPIGGLKGYVLRKRTTADYDVEWYPFDSLANGSGQQLIEYTADFTGTSTGQFTVAKTPYAGKTDVWINQVKIPRHAFSIIVNTIQINTAILNYTITPDDRIEIVYHSTQ